MYNPKDWTGQTCLSLAYSIEHEEFLAHGICQALLTDIWTGKMKTSQESSLKVRLFGAHISALCLQPLTLTLTLVNVKNNVNKTSNFKVSRENYEPCLQLSHGRSLYFGQTGSRAAPATLSCCLQPEPPFYVILILFLGVCQSLKFY